MRWLALLLIIPLISAGTPAEPELSDPAGDTTGGRGDFLTAWVEQVDKTHVDVHATLAEVADQEYLRLDVTWLISGPFGGHSRGPQGARVYLQPDQDEAYVVITTSLGGGLRETDALAVEVTRGEPTTVTVKAVPTGGALLVDAGGGWGGGKMSLFSADVVTFVPATILGATTTAPLDRAGPDGELELAIGGAYATTPWAINGAPVAEYDGDDELPGPADIRRAYLQPNGTGFDFTLEMRSLTHEDAENCGEISVYLHKMKTFSKRSLGGLSSVNFQNGWMARQYDNHDVTTWDDLDAPTDVTFPVDVRWVFGTPGYFQIHAQDVPYSDWGEAPSITVRCGDSKSDAGSSDSFELGQIARVAILPIFFTAVAGLIAAYYQRKHGRRRR